MVKYLVLMAIIAFVAIGVSRGIIGAERSKAAPWEQALCLEKCHMGEGPCNCYK